MPAKTGSQVWIFCLKKSFGGGLEKRGKAEGFEGGCKIGGEGLFFSGGTRHYKLLYSEAKISALKNLQKIRAGTSGLILDFGCFSPKRRIFKWVLAFNEKTA